MAAKLLQKILKLGGHNSRKRHKNSGFTLLELLVGTLIASFVIVGLLNLVVDLLQTDRREYARNETQREIQMALDYMVNDIREAAYIYDEFGLYGGGPDARPGIINNAQLPAGFTPILAFWKPETIPDHDMNALGDCRRFGLSNPLRTECDMLLVRRRSYTLVVYLQKVNDRQEFDRGWKGVSRISRFHVPKYRNVANLEKSTGYVDPSENTVKFETWPIRGDGTPAPGAGIAEGFNQVLVDFIDFPTEVRRSEVHQLDNLTPPANTQCPGATLPIDQRTYSQIPPQGAAFNNPSFMVCVSTNNTIDATGSDRGNVNQDVLVFLRGNPTGKAGVKVAPLLAVRTQAVARGVIDKQGQ
jgi:type II secretory pathway pseudopilin PulG